MQSRKLQEALNQRVADLTDENADLRKKVNMSSVKAVQAAERERDQAQERERQNVKDAEKKADKAVRDAEKAKNVAERKLKVAIVAAKRTQQTSYGLLAFVLLCCAMASEKFLPDAGNFFSVPFWWLNDKLDEYIKWLKVPYYTKSDGMGIHKYACEGGVAWSLRILTALLILAAAVIIMAMAVNLATYYKKRWCSLSLKVLVCTLAVVIVFSRFISINTLLLFFVLQIIYLGVMHYIDGCAENRSWEWKAKWEKVQSGETSLLFPSP